MTPEQLTGNDPSYLTSILIGSKSFLVDPKAGQDLRHLMLTAEKAGFRFHIASGFRSFNDQLSIWNRKVSGELTVRDSNNCVVDISGLTESTIVRAILNWSALPGTSRHHWGTDFDVYDADALPEDAQILLEPWEYKSGHQADFSQWLTENVEKHGFFFPYDKNRGGVAYEPWHISHLETSKHCLSQLSLDVLHQQLNKTEILARESIFSLLDEIYNQYITNINPIGRT